MSTMSIATARRARREDAVRRNLDAYNRCEVDELAATFGERHPRYELIGNHHVYDGRDAVTAYVIEGRTVFPDIRHELIALHHADDAVIAETWLSGTHRGALPDLGPTGRAFRCRVAAFFLFDDTDLRCVRLYFDVGTIARQLAS